MATPIFIDTGYIIALVNQRDQYHAQAIQLSHHYDTADFITTEAILLEIGNALSRNHKSAAIEILHQLLNTPQTQIVPITTARFALALDRYCQYLDKQWGLIDCLSFIVMEEYGVHQVLTFDQHFAQAGFVILTS